MGTSTVGAAVRWEVYNRRTHDAPVSFTTRRAAEAWRGYMGLHAGRWIVRVSSLHIEVDPGSAYAVEVSALTTAGAPLVEARRLAAPARVGTLEVAR